MDQASIGFTQFGASRDRTILNGVRPVLPLTPRAETPSILALYVVCCVLHAPCIIAAMLCGACRMQHWSMMEAELPPHVAFAPAALPAWFHARLLQRCMPQRTVDLAVDHVAPLPKRLSRTPPSDVAPKHCPKMHIRSPFTFPGPIR